LIGRALFAVRNKTAIAHKLRIADLAELIAAAISIFAPNFQLLGPPREELAKQLARNCSRKARKALEAAVQGIGAQFTVELDRWVEGLTCSADRAGLLLSGDIYGALNLVLNEEATSSFERTPLEPIPALRKRPRLEQLVAFVLSDEHFRLREQLGIAV